MSDESLGLLGNIDRTSHGFWRNSPPRTELVGDHRAHVDKRIARLMLSIWQEVCTQRGSSKYFYLVEDCDE